MKALTRAHRITLFLLIAGLLVFLLKRPGLEGDTIRLVSDARLGASCIAEGRSPCVQTGQYPLYQVGPAIALSLLGASHGAITHFFAYLSALSFLLILWIFRLGFKEPRRKPLAHLAWIALLSSFLMRYANSSFGEMLAACLITAAVASVSLGWPIAIQMLLVLFSGTVKETAPPFILILVLGAALGRKVRYLGMQIAALVAAAVASVGLNFGFNLWRFGTIRNPFYWQDPVFNSPRSLGFMASSFISQWISPAGGVAIFAPVFTAILCTALLKRRGGIRQNAPLAACFLTLAGLSLGFSRLSPVAFGWYCWGHRYLASWVPPVLFLVLSFHGESVLEQIHRIARRPYASSLWMALISVLAFPQYMVLMVHSWVDYLCAEWSYWPTSHSLAAIYVPQGPQFLVALIFCAALVRALKTLGSSGD